MDTIQTKFFSFLNIKYSVPSLELMSIAVNNDLNTLTSFNTNLPNISFDSNNTSFGYILNSNDPDYLEVGGYFNAAIIESNQPEGLNAACDIERVKVGYYSDIEAIYGDLSQSFKSKINTLKDSSEIRAYSLGTQLKDLGFPSISCPEQSNIGK